MRLVNFGPGEIADRLTILSLKILHGAAAGKDTKHFLDERNALLTQLRGRELSGPWLEYTLELGAVNSALWQAEDEIRALRALPVVSPTQALVIAFRIPTLNDRRAELVSLINQSTGDHLGEEKV